MANPCADESRRADRATTELNEAYDDVQTARDELEEANDDDTSWSDGLAVVGAVAACTSNPFSWVVCGIGIIGGGYTVVHNNTDRHDKIDKAEKDLNHAMREYWDAKKEYEDAVDAEIHCKLHNKLV